MSRQILAMVSCVCLLIFSGTAAAAPKARPKVEKKSRKARKDGKKEAQGQVIFTSSGCTTCHSITSRSIAKSTPKIVKGGPDLSAVGKRWKTRDLAPWLTQRLKRKGQPHPLKFSGGNDKLQVLVAWLARLR